MVQLETARCLLTAIEAKDRASLLPFFGSVDNLYYYLPTRLRTFDSEALAQELAEWSDGESNLAWAIRLKSGETIGLANFEDIDFDNLTAEMGLLIAFPEFRSRGFASELAEVLFDYAFNTLGLHRVTARVMEGNEPSFRLLKKLGFREEAVMIEALKRPGKFLNLHHFALLKREWLQREKKDD